MYFAPSFSLLRQCANPKLTSDVYYQKANTCRRLTRRPLTRIVTQWRFRVIGISYHRPPFAIHHTSLQRYPPPKLKRVIISLKSLKNLQFIRETYLEVEK